MSRLSSFDDQQTDVTFGLTPNHFQTQKLVKKEKKIFEFYWLFLSLDTKSFLDFPPNLLSNHFMCKFFLAKHSQSMKAEKEEEQKLKIR